VGFAGSTPAIPAIQLAIPLLEEFLFAGETNLAAGVPAAAEGAIGGWPPYPRLEADAELLPGISGVPSSGGVGGVPFTSFR
jgi:hypothetical protein